MDFLGSIHIFGHSTSMNIRLQMTLQHTSFLSVTYPKVGLLECVCFCLDFKDEFLWQSHSFTSPQMVCKSCNFSISSLVLLLYYYHHYYYIFCVWYVKKGTITCKLRSDDSILESVFFLPIYELRLDRCLWVLRTFFCLAM